MQKIPFVDYVCNQIAQGNFISASTKCNYLIYGTVDSGERQEFLNKRRAGDRLVFDPDAFSIRIEPSLFGLSRKVYLSRQTSPRGSRGLTITDKQADQLYEAWKIAAGIQEKRNEESDEEWMKRTDALHWWP